MRICYKCKLSKVEFTKKSSYCKACTKILNANRMTQMKGRYFHWRGRAREYKIEWSLTLEYLESLPQVCYYTGVNLTLEQKRPNTISLDRLDSSKGYLVGNVVFCCADINRMKQEFQVDYFLNLCKQIASYSLR